MKNLRGLAKDCMVEGFDYNVSQNVTFCELCIGRRQHQAPFPKTGVERSDKLLEIVHSDVCGKIEEKSLSEAETLLHLLTTNHDMCGCMMKYKSEAYRSLESGKQWLKVKWI